MNNKKHANLSVTLVLNRCSVPYHLLCVKKLILTTSCSSLRLYRYVLLQIVHDSFFSLCIFHYFVILFTSIFLISFISTRFSSQLPNINSVEQNYSPHCPVFLAKLHHSSLLYIQRLLPALIPNHSFFGNKQTTLPSFKACA